MGGESWSKGNHRWEKKGDTYYKEVKDDILWPDVQVERQNVTFHAFLSVYNRFCI